MKVLHIISGNDNGGGGEHVLNLSYYCKGKFESVIGAIGEGPLYEKALKKNMEIFKLENKLGKNEKLLEYVDNNKIDIVNFHGAKAFFMHYFLKNYLKIPSVAVVHSNYKQDFLNNKFKHIFFTPLSMLGLKSFKNYICVSSYIKELLERDHFSGKKFVISNGIDFHNSNQVIPPENIRKDLGIKPNDFVYTNVARMHPIKNQSNMIDAFYKLKKDIDNVKLLIVGDGPLQSELKQRVSKLKLDKDILFLGFKNDVINIMNASDVNILTSLSEGGCPPIVILESALVKKAFICSDVGDVNKIINERTGFLVNPLSIDDIYNKMKIAYEKKEELKVMGENLYNMAKENYSIENFCEDYYTNYKYILLNNVIKE